ncbi:MAG: outer membrane beta-barrel protein [Candidatus Omnitrophota bacterium]
MTNKSLWGKIPQVMKFGLAIIVILFMVGEAYPMQMAASARVGVTFPHSSLYDPGMSANIGINYYVTPSITLEGVLGYHMLVGKSFGIPNLDVWQLSLNGRVYFFTAGPLKPYVNGGFGLYFQKERIQSATSHFGFNVGAGLDYYLNPSLALELAYNFHCIQPGDWSLKFSALQAGLRFHF